MGFKNLNLAFLHVLESSSLTSNAVVLSDYPRYTDCAGICFHVSATSIINFCIILACLSESNSLVPASVITWSGLFSVMQGFI